MRGVRSWFKKLFWSQPAFDNSQQAKKEGRCYKRCHYPGCLGSATSEHAVTYQSEPDGLTVWTPLCFGHRHKPILDQFCNMIERGEG